MKTKNPNAQQERHKMTPEEIQARREQRQQRMAAQGQGDMTQSTGQGNMTQNGGTYGQQGTDNEVYQQYYDQFVQGHIQQANGQAQQGNGQWQQGYGQTQPQQGYNQYGNSQLQQGYGQAQFQQGFVSPQEPVQAFTTSVKRKKPIIPVIIGIVLVVALIFGAVKVVNMIKLANTPMLIDSASSGKQVYDNILVALNTYDAETLDSLIGVEEGDSYLAQEWAYVNRVQLREEFLSKIGSLVRFTYPQEQVLNRKGEVMTDDLGNPLTQTSAMSNGEAITVTVPDYAELENIINGDSEYILQLYKSSDYSEDSYTFEEDLFNLFCQYVVDSVAMPTKQVDVKLPLGTVVDGSSIVVDDSELDDALFGTDEFHNACKAFSQICVQFTGKGTETYKVKEEVHNDEYDEWYAVFKKYYDADNGKFNPKTSKWEPWYVRDKNNKLILDENGEKIVNYYSVKDENGNDWIQPDETILVEVEKTREIDVPWVEERGIPYVMVGTNYLQNKYTGSYPTVFRVGDGSRDFPAGIGTTIVTHVLCTDGQYHNVKVAMQGYWTDQDAIDYAESFSTKNKGFTTTSPVKLICFEFTVENLEEEPITFVSEMTICDRNANVGSRTGTLYGFYEQVTLEAHETKMLNDWASSTELEQKYIAWGKSFGRTYPLVYFDMLAGTGYVPSYSAYEKFTGTPKVTQTMVETTAADTADLQYKYSEEEIDERADEIAQEQTAEAESNNPTLFNR